MIFKFCYTGVVVCSVVVWQVPAIAAVWEAAETDAFCEKKVYDADSGIFASSVFLCTGTPL